MAGQRWPAAVEAKTLLWASPLDAGQYLSQQGGIHLGQEQQLGATPRRRHKQKAQFASAYSRSPSRMIAQFALMGCTGTTFAHCAPCAWPQKIGWSPLVMKVVCYFCFARRLYDMNENVFAFFLCLLFDGWLLLRNVELISILRPYIMVPYDVGAFMQVNLLLLKRAFMRVNLLLLNEEMWEAGSKWKTPQSKFVTVKTWGNTRKIENLERKT
uniref:Uncharacterized protein n=1 Tax=Oryza meridionalis TaxID=40149 RepID=A0A0E0DAV2_9ORYZ